MTAAERNAKYRVAHPDRVRVAGAERRARNREKLRAADKVYRATHKPEITARRASRSATVRAYMQQYNLANKARLSAQKRAYWAAHREAMNANQKAYYESHRQEHRLYAVRNRTAIAQRNAAHRIANRGHYTARQRQREAAKLRATPAWANQDAIKALYVEAAQLARETGIQHDVDHIVPLKGSTVCGLHVEYNLQILTHDENVRKSNRFPLATAS